MKNDRKPTLKQKKVLMQAKLNTKNWLVRCHTARQLIIVHRVSGNTRKLSC